MEFCKRHSWLTPFGTLRLNQPVCTSYMHLDDRDTTFLSASCVKKPSTPVLSNTYSLEFLGRKTRSGYTGMVRRWLCQRCTPRTDDDLYDLYDIFPLHDLDLSGQIDLYDLYDLAHVAGWEPYNVHDLQYIMCPGLDLHHTDPAQHTTSQQQVRTYSRRSRWSR